LIVAFQATQATRILGRATIALLAVMHVFPSAFGQEPSPEGPQNPTYDAELEELKARVRQLERKLSELEKKEEASPAPLSPGTTTVPFIDRERGMFREDAYGEPRVDNAPFDPSLRGFWAIPHTDSLMRIGGYIRTDAIYDTAQLGNRFQFRPSTIPTPNLKTSNYNMNIRPSRLMLETRTNTSFDTVRTFIEVDFVGPDESVELRIRHFWVQLKCPRRTSLVHIQRLGCHSGNR
jgi:porin-like protein